MRYLYTVLLYVAMPYILLRLWWRGKRLPAYRERLAERFGRYPFTLEKCIWVHAVSVGETVAVTPLVQALKTDYPHLPILITTMTPTGAARVKTIFGDSVKHVYLPYDYPLVVQQFLNSFHPVMGILVETELWPNLLFACQQKKIPICLVNARLSAKSAKTYSYVSSLTREMLQSLTKIAAQGQLDAELFMVLGAPIDRVVFTGNIKFDLKVPAGMAEKSMALRESLGRDRFIWVAASTHEGEEELILAAHKKLRESIPHALLILVPRHPDRFAEVADLIKRQQFSLCMRSQNEPCTADISVYLADTMGELFLLYGAADVAFVGGSLIERGGHNVLEPASLAKPVLTGVHMFNFSEISALLEEGKGLIKVSNPETLASNLVMLANNPLMRTEMGVHAKQVVDANRGALEKQLAVVKEVMGVRGLLQ